LDSRNYDEVVNDVDADHWVKVMEIELEYMYSNKVLKLVEVLNVIKHIGCKWVCSKKKWVDETFDARLVAKCFTQKGGVDYEETCSLVVMLKSI